MASDREVGVIREGGVLLAFPLPFAFAPFQEFMVLPGTGLLGRLSEE